MIKEENQVKVMEHDALEEYILRAESTLLPQCYSDEYLLHGLSSEAGEVAGVRKKFLREDFPMEDYLTKMESELFDVFYYWIMLCRINKFKPTDLIEKGFDKLQKRKHDGNIQGSGDVR